MILVAPRSRSRVRPTLRVGRSTEQRNRPLAVCAALVVTAAVIVQPPGALGRLVARLPATALPVGRVAPPHRPGPWRPVYGYPLSVEQLTGVSCPSASTCEAVGTTIGSTIALQTSDGGKSWASEPLPIAGAPAVSCPSTSMCLVAGRATSGVLPPAAVARTTNGGASWSSVKMGPENANLTSIACASTSVCEAAGVSGPDAIAFRTADGGLTWEPETLPDSAGDIDALACPSVSVCYAVFNTHLGDIYSAFVTSDGGASWRSTQLSGFNMGVHEVSAIACPSVSTCVTAGNSEGPGDGKGDFGFTFKTSNGGRTWHRSAVRIYRGEPAAIACVSDLACEMVGYSSLNQGGAAVRTTDGGATWQRTLLPAPIGELDAVACASASSCASVGGTVSGSGAVVVATTNGGVSWESGRLPVGTGQPNGIGCATAASCTVVGFGASYSGAIGIVTANTWKTSVMSKPPVFVSDLLGVSCPSPSVCYTVGESSGTGRSLAELRIRNGRPTWVREHLGRAALSLDAISCASTSTCVVVGQTFPGNDPIAYRTTDAGAHWMRENFTVGRIDLTGVACPSVTHCFAIGNGRGPPGVEVPGTAFRTTDGGLRWTVLRLAPPHENLSGVACSSASTCELIGSRAQQSSSCDIGVRSPPCYVAVTLHTTNGGTKWADQRLPADVGSLEQITCPSRSTCAALGTTALGSAHCVYYENGYACARGGGAPMAIETADAGARWSNENVPSDIEQLDGIACPVSSACDVTGYTSSDEVVLAR